MNELVDWLRVQLDEDARVARAAQGHGVDALVSNEAYAHLTRWRAARVLRDVAAKRAIVDEHPNVNDGDCGTCVRGRWGYPTHGGSDPVLWPCETLRHLASAYDDRPGYREEWKP